MKNVSPQKEHYLNKYLNYLYLSFSVHLSCYFNDCYLFIYFLFIYFFAQPFYSSLSSICVFSIIRFWHFSFLSPSIWTCLIILIWLNSIHFIVNVSLTIFKASVFRFFKIKISLLHVILSFLSISTVSWFLFAPVSKLKRCCANAKH